MKRINLPTWLIILILFIGIIRLLGFIVSIFQSYPLIFFIVWILLPLFALLGKHHMILFRFSQKGITLFRVILITTAILIAFLFIAHSEYFRNNYGKSNIEGYHVTYDTDYDSFGRPITVSKVHTKSISTKALIYLFGLIYAVLCFGVPILTWKVSTITLEAWESQIMSNKQN